jgi:putative phage-type endonuclease
MTNFNCRIGGIQQLTIGGSRMPLTPEQMEIRKRGITGSNIAAVVGLDPYRGPFDVYMEYKGLSEPLEMNHHLERGIFLEPAIINWFAHRTKREIEECGTIVHSEHPLCIATPDAISHINGDDRRVLEIKAPGRFKADDWGDPGTDAIPEYYIPQIMWECAVTGLANADVVAFVDGNIEIYKVPYNQSLFEALLDAAGRFWHNNILKDEPPAPDGSEKTRQWFLNKYPQSMGGIVEATPEVAKYAQIYLQARDMEKEIEERKKSAANNLRLAMLDAETLIGCGVRVTYKNNKDVEFLDYDSLLNDLQVTQDMIKKHTKRRAGSRVLRVNLLKGESK